MKKGLILVLAALAVGFSGCVKDLSKENFSETTTLIGRVIEESTQRPVADVKVSITNGSRTYASYTTKEDGNFELQVNFDKLGKDYYLLMDGGTAIKTKKSELRGMGMEMYDYTNIILYNATETDGVSVTSLEITSITASSADCKAEIIAGTDVSVTKKGFCWSSSIENPTISNHITDNGSGVGDYTGSIIGLAEKTNYYVRAYAQTIDTVVYSESKSFTTKPLYSSMQYDGITYTVYHEVEAMTWDAAMAYCESLTASGFDDWFLPNRDELNALYMNSSSIEGLTNDKYWSSAEYSSSQAYYQDFETGEQNHSSKTTTYKVRPVRTGQNNQTKPTVVTGNITEITQNSVKCSGNVTDNGGSLVTKRGVCYSKTANPTLSDLHVSNGSGVGSFTCSISDLELNTTYYVCAYATNSAGTSYGTPQSFKTHKIPTVNTGVVTDITSTSAKCKGNISSDGDCYVQSRGICWSTVSNPTIENSTATNGSGLGEYTCEMKNLANSTTYYVRAFAKYAGGVEYGTQRSFNTQSLTPAVTTGSITNVSGYSATCSGNVLSEGESSVTQRGICYSLAPNPTINNSIVTCGTGIGSFTCTLTNLTNNTTYHVKAYAINSYGVAYGEEKTFNTELFSTFQYGGYTYYVAPDPEIIMTWSEANSYCNGLSVLGLSGWRLPTQAELMQMYYNRVSIGGFVDDYYWSSTKNSANQHISINFMNGYVFSNGVDGNHMRVRPIRRVN